MADELAQYGDFATCPYTGLMIPKTVAGNLAWRKKLLDTARSSVKMQRHLKQASSASPIFWINAFGWTFLQKEVGEDGIERKVDGSRSHVPFITWKVQDDAIVELVDAIDNGKDVLISKSRDMGASWVILAVFHWYWQFRPSTTFLELSRKEALVDKRGDMDSLFEKHRYLLRWQPDWLKPKRIKDNKLHLENQDIGTSIEGESTNENAGQASRKTAILLDEFARVENGEEIDLATADTSACRIYNSTPGGPNTHFTRIFRGLKTGSREGKLIELPWWRHPKKGAGAYKTDEHEKSVWTSPWREAQKLRRSKRNLAQNIDMEHGRAGDVFFDPEEIEKHRAAYEVEPLLVGNILFDEDLTEEHMAGVVRKMAAKTTVWIDIGTFQPWRLWIPLVDGRPNQHTRYVMAVDISGGSGASNSVISVLDHSTNMIVAKFWDAFTSPEQLAVTVAMAGVFFGGRKPPLVVFEKNGPGVIFGKKLLRLGYPAIYYQKIDTGKKDKPTPRWGWHSSTSRKEMLLGDYRDALKTGKIINPCKEALDEALDYVYDSNGKVEPGSVGFEEGGGQALHGDHVIADALCVLGRADLPSIERDIPSKPPQHTFAARRDSHRRRMSEREAWSR